MDVPEYKKFFEILGGRDPVAVEGLLVWLNPWLRAAIRLRLSRRQLRGKVETSEVFQSLLTDFVRRSKAVREEPDRQVEMEGYLAAAVENKIRWRLRRRRRDARIPPGEAVRDGVVRSVETALEGNDLASSIRARLDLDTRQLFDLRLQGMTWPEMARRYGSKPDTLRMQLRRSVARVIAQFDERESTRDR